MENTNPEHNNTFNNLAWQQALRDGMQTNMSNLDGSIPSLSALTSPTSSGGGPTSWHNSGLSFESPNGQQRGEGLPPAPLTDGLHPDGSYHQGMSSSNAMWNGADHNGALFNANSPTSRAPSLTPTRRRRREPSLSYGSSLPVHHEEGFEHPNSHYTASSWSDIMPTPLSPDFTHRTTQVNNSFAQQQHGGLGGHSVEHNPFGDCGSRDHHEPEVNQQQNPNVWQHILGMRGQMANPTQHHNANQDPVDPAGFWITRTYQAPSQFHINSPQYAPHSMGPLQQQQQQENPHPGVALPFAQQQEFIPDLPQGTPDRLNESTHSHSSSVARRFGNFHINDGQSISRPRSTSYSTTYAEDEASFTSFLPFRDIVASPSRLSRSSEHSSSVSQLHDSVDSFDLDVLDVLDDAQEDPQGVPGQGPVLRHGSAASNNAVPAAAAVPPPPVEHPPPGQPMLELNNQDVLGGQGSGPAMRTSNQRYLQKVRSLQDAYQMLSLKDQGKQAIVMEVFSFVHEQGGRFVKKRRPTDSLVVELSLEEAREKIRRALCQKDE